MQVSSAGSPFQSKATPVVRYKNLLDFTAQTLEDAKEQKSLTSLEAYHVARFKKRLEASAADDSAGVKARALHGTWMRRIATATLGCTAVGAFVGAAVFSSGVHAVAGTVTPMASSYLMLGSLGLGGLACWPAVIQSDRKKFVQQVSKLEAIVAAQLQEAGVNEEDIHFDTKPARKVFADPFGDVRRYQPSLPSADELAREASAKEAEWHKQLPAGRPRATVGIACTSWAAHDACRGYGSAMNYIRAVIRAGGEPRLIFYMRGAPEAQMQDVDALLIPGGRDIDPSQYGMQPGPYMSTYGTNKTFDEFELACIRNAYDNETPMLGICRGQQLMNVAAGGTLIQDIDGEFKPPAGVKVINHRYGGFGGGKHAITIAPNSRLRALLETDRTVVNSLHHQCIGALGVGLVVAACANDHVIEAIERPDVPSQLGVQFHPEQLDERRFGRLFEDLVANGAAYAQHRLAAASKVSAQPQTEPLAATAAEARPVAPSGDTRCRSLSSE